MDRNANITGLLGELYEKLLAQSLHAVGISSITRDEGPSKENLNDRQN